MNKYLTINKVVNRVLKASYRYRNSTFNNFNLAKEEEKQKKSKEISFWKGFKHVIREIAFYALILAGMGAALGGLTRGYVINKIFERSDKEYLKTLEKDQFNEYYKENIGIKSASKKPIPFKIKETSNKPRRNPEDELWRGLFSIFDSGILSVSGLYIGAIIGFFKSFWDFFTYANNNS